MPLADFLTLERRRADIDPSSQYKLVTLAVKGKGARLRKTVPGSELGSAKYEVRAGDLMVSKIDARKGASSLLPDELDGAVVTGDFLSYEVSRDVTLPAFLDLWVRQPEFADLCDTISGGTTNRVRLDLHRFPGLTLPIPPLVEQRRIVDLIGALDECLASARAVAAASRDLLIKVREALCAGGSSVVIGDVLRPVKSAVEVRADAVYHEIGIRSHGRGTFRKEPKSGRDLGNKKVFWMNPGCLCFSIVFAWEGAVAVLGPAIEGTIASHRFPNYASEQDAGVEFLAEYFRTRAGLALLSDCSPGGAGRNRTLNRGRLMGSTIQVPHPDRWPDHAETLRATSERTEAAAQVVHSLSEVRSNLLTALLSGEHAIPESYDELMEATG